MYYAAGRFSHSIDVNYSLANDGMLDLVIQPDQEWLDKAVYPVVIDPITGIVKQADAYYRQGTLGGTTWRFSAPFNLYVGRVAPLSIYHT